MGSLAILGIEKVAREATMLRQKEQGDEEEGVVDV